MGDRHQNENEPEEVYKLAIEIMYIYYAFPYHRSISFKTKINKFKMIASWKDIELDTSLSVFDGLKGGIGATGTFYLTSKYVEVTYLFLVAEYLKQQPFEKRKDILNDPKDLKNVAENMRKQVGKRVQMQHIILHLLLPDYYESIAS